ncbi:MAG: hypothetical protein OEW35_03835 [Gammaproteobacteria bacterium]|nr:hypothetical protein [Gammaproteobacteria bacterium]
MFSRKLDEWAQIAEIVAAFSVVVSLVFVGLQVRQNTTAVRSSAAQAIHENYAAWYLATEGDPALLAISIRGMRDYASLSDIERAQFIAQFMAFCSYTQNAYYKWKEGSLAPELWRGWEYTSMNFFSTDGGKAFWSERAYLFSDDFRAYIEGDIMLRPPHPDAKPWGAYRIGEQ